MTFLPGSDNAVVQAVFSEFSTENNYDYLYIYDGTSTNAPQIGSYCGTNSPGTVTATNGEGALTFRFTSDNGMVDSGWVASINCIYSEPVLTGDVNLDGVISIDDVSVLLSHVLGNISLTGQTLLNADVNGDGAISIDDVSTLLFTSMNK